MINAPVVMGIINITPDSFYSNSRQFNVHAALLKAEQMMHDGATIIDIGGQSTRPGSEKISVEEELNRVIPVIENIHKELPEAFISIDTYYAAVAQKTIEAGADIVNDISSGDIDEAMIAAVAALKVPYISMHMQGNPQNMQQQTSFYNNVTKDVLDYFITKTEECRLAGINDIIIDPGLGFGKTIEQNFELLKNLSAFKILQKPILLGLSRKSMIYKTLKTTPEESLAGTITLNTIGLINGANIIRVHDVKEVKESIVLFAKYKA